MCDIVCSKYKLSDVIGSGKFGIVMKAMDKAHKVFAVKLSASDGCLLIRNEAIVLNYLNSKKCRNVPIVHWYGIYGETPCIVIPYYNCCLINAKTPCMDLINQMLIIIKNVHDLCVIHRDIKPENFMINHKNEVVLIDFGLATFCLKNKVEHIERTTFTGNILYASPNIHGFKEATKIDDIISIAYVYIYLCSDCRLPWMELEDDEFKMGKIFNLKKIENIVLQSNFKTAKIVSIIDRFYNGIVGYDI